MQRIGPAVECSLTDRSDKVLDCHLVDVLGVDTMIAGIPGQARKSDVGAPVRQLGQKLAPCRPEISSR